VVVNKTLWHNPRVLRALCLAGVLAAAIAGCYWLRYHDLVETHCELLEDLSVATLAQVEASPPRIAPGDVERLRYPLERVREFIGIAEKRFAGRASLVELGALVNVYAELIDAVERMRIGVSDGATIPPLVTDIRAHAERVRAAIHSEQS
jgi:hypothetical protein